MLHYTLCGLDNVWLANGYERRETAYGPGVSIQDADGLHALLAHKLLDKPGRLTGKELRFLRVQLGLSQAGFAKLHGVSEQSVSLWERHGKVPLVHDQLTRLQVLGHREGDTPLRDAIERTRTVERLVHQRIVLKATRKGWTSTDQAAATG